MVAWRLKGYPRCEGDVFLDRDEENRWYEQCLQCGCFNELKDIAKTKEQLIGELGQMRQRVAALETIEDESKGEEASYENST